MTTTSAPRLATTSQGKRAGQTADLNRVALLGRLSAAAERRLLPSGDEVVTFRLVVPRRSRGPQRVDTIDCSVWTARLQERALRWEPGTQLAVEGALRRRFWRSPGGPRSRYDVEVARARRLKGAGDEPLA